MEQVDIAVLKTAALGRRGSKPPLSPTNTVLKSENGCGNHVVTVMNPHCIIGAWPSGKAPHFVG